MLAILSACYPWTMVIMLGSILVWFFRDELGKSNVTTMLIFGAAAVLYVPALFACEGSLFHKLIWNFGRDVATLAGMIWIGDHLKTGRAFVLAAIVFLACSLTFYFDWLESSVRPRVAAAGGQAAAMLESTAELLFDIRNVDDLESLRGELLEFGVTIEPAFAQLQHPEYSELEEYYTIDVPEARLGDIGEITSIMERSGLVDHVEKNHVVRLSPMELQRSAAAPEKEGVLGINDPHANQQWWLDALHVGEYYEWLSEQQPQQQTLVAILDTGVAGDHEDLQANFTSIDGKHDNDKLSHGTHCAGVAAAVSGNGIGVASMADDRFMRVTSVKVLDDNGIGSERSIIAGIIEAVDNGANVLSLSLGGPTTGEKQKAEEEAIKYAENAGAIVIVAAGNSGGDAREAAPACCKGVIVVTALDSSLKMAGFSNEVSGIEMAVAAPGVDIYSTIPGDKYAAFSGTSMATPAVAGLVGMMKSLNPDLTSQDAHRILTETGATTEAGSRSGALIDPLSALQQVTSASVPAHVDSGALSSRER